MIPSNIHRCFELKDRTQLLFTGPDRLRYLNGQVTQDLRKLSKDRALPACVTNAKGRLQADVWISDLGEALLLDAPPTVTESLLARLERYIVADDVSIEDQTKSHTTFHCLDRPSSLPQSTNNPVVQTSRLGLQGWDLRVPSSVRAITKQALGASDDSDSSWEWLRISNGVPAWGSELSEDTLPPEALLDLTHIDYHKGCYIGQEVLSRIRSVGHVNRRLVLLSAPASKDSVGSKLFDQIHPSRESTHSIGHITSISLFGDSVLALAYLKRGAGAAVVVSQEGTVFDVRELSPTS